MIGKMNLGSGGGIDLDGLIEQYKVANGTNVNAGSFVKFIEEYDGGIDNRNTFYKNTAINRSYYPWIVSCALTDNKVLIAYNDSSENQYICICNISKNNITFSSNTMISASKYLIALIRKDDNNAYLVCSGGGIQYYNISITTSGITELSEEITCNYGSLIYSVSSLYYNKILFGKLNETSYIFVGLNTDGAQYPILITVGQDKLSGKSLGSATYWSKPDYFHGLTSCVLSETDSLIYNEDSYSRILRNCKHSLSSFNSGVGYIVFRYDSYIGTNGPSGLGDKQFNNIIRINDTQALLICWLPKDSSEYTEIAPFACIAQSNGTENPSATVKTQLLPYVKSSSSNKIYSYYLNENLICVYIYNGTFHKLICTIINNEINISSQFDIDNIKDPCYTINTQINKNKNITFISCIKSDESDATADIYTELSDYNGVVKTKIKPLETKEDVIKGVTKQKGTEGQVIDVYVPNI